MESNLLLCSLPKSFQALRAQLLEMQVFRGKPCACATCTSRSLFGEANLEVRVGALAMCGMMVYIGGSGYSEGGADGRWGLSWRTPVIALALAICVSMHPGTSRLHNSESVIFTSSSLYNVYVQVPSLATLASATPSVAPLAPLAPVTGACVVVLCEHCFVEQIAHVLCA